MFCALQGHYISGERLQDYWSSGLVACKYEEDPIKNEGARVLTRFYVVFLDAQGQLTPKSALKFCRNSNSSKLL